MNESLLLEIINLISNSLKVIPGIYKLFNKSFVNNYENKILKSKGVSFSVENNVYIFNIYVILIKDINILDVLKKAQKTLQYDLSSVKFLMDKQFILNFYVNAIHQ